LIRHSAPGAELDPQRPVFGTVRYMTAAGLRRKIDMDAYLKRVEHLARTTSNA